jgi:hypothetical protein
MKNRWSCTTALMLVSCPVLAQSSVTIYVNIYPTMNKMSLYIILVSLIFAEKICK